MVRHQLICVLILTAWHYCKGTVSQCCLLVSHFPLFLTAVSWKTCRRQRLKALKLVSPFYILIYLYLEIRWVPQS